MRRILGSDASQRRRCRAHSRAVSLTRGLPVSAGEGADAVTHHSDTIDGTAYPYTARAGTITLTNTHDQPTANVFYTAYTLDGAIPVRVL